MNARHLMNAPSDHDDSLILWMLSLTPAERLAVLQDNVNAVLKIRALNGLPADSEDTPRESS
jgi:hypothetical protein